MSAGEEKYYGIAFGMYYLGVMIGSPLIAYWAQKVRVLFFFCAHKKILKINKIEENLGSSNYFSCVMWSWKCSLFFCYYS